MIQLTVTRTEAVTPVIRRVWFRSDDLSAFAQSDWTDRYVKLQFPDAVRTYTALFPDVAAGTLAIDFVTHGDEGVAGPWARPPDRVTRSRCAAREAPTVPTRRPTGTCLPATSRRCPRSLLRSRSCPPRRWPGSSCWSRTPATSRRCRCPQGAELTVLHRATMAEGQSLASAVRALEWLPGRVHAFVHGEAAEVMHDIRPYLLKERGLDRDQVSISGYWRRGRSEEGFRQWKAELRAAEGASV